MGGFLYLALSTQPQTHAQTGQHNYQHHTPTLTQTSLGGQHLAERLTQLTTGLGRKVNDHKEIKAQLETIAEEQQTHQTTPFTLIDSAADTGYVSDNMLIHRTMGEMVSTAHTAKQDVNITSSTKAVEVVATNKITLTAGGASITLDDGDITITAKQFTEKGGKHSKAGGGVDGLSLAGLPNLIAGAMYKAKFRFADDDDAAYGNTPYVAIKENTKETFEGMTDDNGNTETFYSSDSDEIKVHLKLDNYTAQFRFADDCDIPYSFVDYIAQAEITGEMFEGTTDKEGFTDMMYTSIEQNITIHLKND
ncbi:DUF2345 domain-containing protein [uncultured Psychrobacter sp.]|uniref:DUF2345 domain-containing protein n=1 Tax=uncultured Psychrobacter sp. TaxID=259303 RepID=UPI0026054691|nr:DUF2345 domain-containing protein [uncultured Psychrobacter sp.]